MAYKKKPQRIWEKKHADIWKRPDAVSSSAATNKLMRYVIILMLPLRIIRKSSSNNLAELYGHYNTRSNGPSAAAKPGRKT